ncbi:TPA: hypothetical protein DEO28_02455 [Candidatus Dependentiae bacterium]|nr:MAG: Triosephosphate isomerase [candidate division TM6 bacterium GW2011_GWE2_31_21]KKP53255.1 MAG: Triosephosphate isomerase [candidate division TM6 bacterium GW2011_GWF2_33_332]HBS48046.1 hypothetical protein [Candidatus Dependentiae bacterium]HBZ73351.1 hypothetical protein [Candidatus Dependentiae bacterium]
MLIWKKLKNKAVWLENIYKVNLMDKKYIVVSNWKMNKCINDALTFCTSNLESLIKISETEPVSIILCPSFLGLYPLIKIFKDTSIKIGSQDCSSHLKGSYTGQISAECLHEISCDFCIIGHNERRKYNNEKDEEIVQKFFHLINFDINPILCIGETKEQFETKQTFKILEEQLKHVLELFNSNFVKKTLTPCISYEPTWSIGTGDIPDKKHLEVVFAWLANICKKNASMSQVKLLYGGSVSEDSIDMIKKINFIDGFLIGNKSLEFESFVKIISKLKK